VITKLHIPPALKNRRYAMLWGGLLVSIAGSQMQLWAMFWHIRTLSDQPIAISGIGVVRFLPVLVFSLVGGLAADTFSRRKIMFLTQSTMALVALALGLLTWWGHITIWHIYLLTAIQAVATAFDAPARQSLVPNLVRKEDLPNAFSMQSIASDIGSIIGPALSGLVIGYMGQQFTYLINAVSFVAVLAALVAMGPVPQNTTKQTEQKINPLTAIGDGIRFIRSSPIILSSMIIDFFATFFASANTLMPFVARDVLKVGAIAYGWLSAAQSIGAVVAALIISQRDQIRRQGALLVGAVVAFGLATILFGLATSFVLTMLALILVGAADAVSTILRNTLRQLQTPDAMRGRMVSINQIFFMGGPQLGEIEAGMAAQALGTPFAIISGGVGTILAVGLVLLKWPALKHYNGDEPVLAGSPAD
jgi:MFS family permease